MPVDRAQLGAFLRSRRDRLSPAQAGIRAFPGPRRVPGLRAAISITDVVHATPGDSSSPVTAYTVNVIGDYAVDMRLGDLQRSVTRVLDDAMQSEPFQQLAAEQGVNGIHVGSYTSQFDHLPQFVTVDKSKITFIPNGPGRLRTLRAAAGTVAGLVERGGPAGKELECVVGGVPDSAV